MSVPVWALAQERGLVRVNIVKTSTGKDATGETVELNGRAIPNYRPTIIQVFPATGVVLDDAGNVLTFLGYRWIDVYGGELRVEILPGAGQVKLRGKLIGIDQSTGVAVVRAVEGKLAKTPLCLGCEIRDGTTVFAPFGTDGGARFEEAQVVSVSSDGFAEPGRWHLTINRQLPGIGEPILDGADRVLGFTAGQPANPGSVEMPTVVFPISQLLTSATRVVAAGGDVSTGWLGVYLDDAPVPTGKGVRIGDVVPSGPAAQAGLRSGDVLLRWNGSEVAGPRQLIRAVQETEAGTRVDLAVLRAGKPFNLQAVVATRRPEARRGLFVLKFPEEITLPNPTVQAELIYRADAEHARPRIGVGIVALTAQLARFLEIPVRVGLLVTAVEPGMPAALAGVQAGDVILSVDGQPVSDEGSFIERIRARGWGGTVALRLLRRKSEQVIRLVIRPPGVLKAWWAEIWPATGSSKPAVTV